MPPVPRSPLPRRLLRLTALLATSVTLSLSVACGGGGGGGGDWGGGEEASVPGPERRVLVDAAPVEPGSVADYLITSGTLEGEFQADLFPEATGVVSKVYVEEGDTVRAGQILALISNPSLDAGAQRASVDVAAARRALQEAEGLHSSGAISDRELQDAKDGLARSRASYGEATRSRGFTRIDSPIAGTVSIREVRAGELANSGRRAFQVVDLDRLRVVVQLPERDLARISHGQTALLTSAYDEDAQVGGTVSRISPVVDATTGTVKVTVDVEAGQTVIRPGQYVKVRVEVDRHTDVLTIPRRALVWDDGEPVAWKVVEAEAPEAKDGDEDDAEAEDEGGGFLAQLFGGEGSEEGGDDEPEKDPWEGIPRRGVEKARLEIGYVDTERVEVIEGLSKADQVVKVGNGGLRPETLVKLPGDPEPAPEEDPPEEAAKSEGKAAEGAEG